ncbi:MAG: 3'-phosphoesterase [Rikenellaceae bacterium]|nr:3'-phosphoesterase [Rikenellaceae bacterium]
MALTEYNRKRDFDDTPEPEGRSNTDNVELIFVVQRHDARQLHFDFRLELEGVFKSWAVPKGPSMNPADKRLAVMVEDHPLDYADFEGEIPEGNYGAGSVEIWDHGTWSPDAKFKNPSEAIRKGLIEFTLHGKILKGEFALVELKNSTTKNGWLLIKGRDRYAVDEKYNADEVRVSAR